MQVASKMLLAGDFVEAAQQRGFSLWTGVPCSYLQPFINYVISEPSLSYIPASNEGDAISIAAGYEIGGGLSVVMMQNSGLGNAVNPLTSLCFPHKIPMLLIVSLRGEPQGAADEPQHELMGSITIQLLDLMKIKWSYFPTEASLVSSALDSAMAVIKEEKLPYCLVMRKGSVAAHAEPEHHVVKAEQVEIKNDDFPTEITITRSTVMKLLLNNQKGNDIFLATTGFTGRELYSIKDQANNLYLVGAMGCASSVGLGLALARPELRVIVLDGDGALLMRMGALATIGYVAPANLIHIVLDNGQHESTGGQETISKYLHLAAIAKACGYVRSEVVLDFEEMTLIMQSSQLGPAFYRIPIAAGVPEALPRPTITPAETTQRMRKRISEINLGATSL